MNIVIMFNQLGNLIINSTQHYIFFYALGSIFGIDDVNKLHTIGFIGFLCGSFTSFCKI
jgi:hypothetical protein